MEKPDVIQTEKAISYVKKTFASKLRKKLKLTEVSSPIAILDGTGINDDLNGTEQPVGFSLKDMGGPRAVIVQSLAKWKRLRLHELAIPQGQGILTHMHALRPDELLSPLHSIYVDQWDWEKHIPGEKRTLEYLQQAVRKIYKALYKTEKKVAARFTSITPVLPQEITFIHAEDLARRYPGLSSQQLENLAAREYGAVFIMGIGHSLSHGEPHEGRAPDYDDWSTINADGYHGLNGDIIVWNTVLEQAFEISSMGIRVDQAALLRQLEITHSTERKQLLFHRMLLNGELPASIGGGIGQSRLCMFMLRKKHIGEVQVGIWPQTLKDEMHQNKEMVIL